MVVVWCPPPITEVIVVEPDVMTVTEADPLTELLIVLLPPPTTVVVTPDDEATAELDEFAAALLDADPEAAVAVVDAGPGTGPPAPLMPRAIR